MASKLKNNPEEKDLTSRIDTFLFYRNRDRYGFLINSVNDDQSKWDQDLTTLLDALIKHVEEFSKKKLIFNKFRF